jgi:hypothetical protein
MPKTRKKDTRSGRPRQGIPAGHILRILFVAVLVEFLESERDLERADRVGVFLNDGDHDETPVEAFDAHDGVIKRQHRFGGHVAEKPPGQGMSDHAELDDLLIQLIHETPKGLGNLFPLLPTVDLERGDFLAGRKHQQIGPDPEPDLTEIFADTDILIGDGRDDQVAGALARWPAS